MDGYLPGTDRWTRPAATSGCRRPGPWVPPRPSYPVRDRRHQARPSHSATRRRPLVDARRRGGTRHDARHGVSDPVVAGVRRGHGVQPRGARPLRRVPGAVLRPVAGPGELRRAGPGAPGRPGVARLRECAGDLVRGPGRAVRAAAPQLGRVAVRRVVARRPAQPVLHRHVPGPAPGGVAGRRAAARRRDRRRVHRRAGARRPALRHQPARHLRLHAGAPGDRDVAARGGVRRRVPGHRDRLAALSGAPGRVRDRRRGGRAVGRARRTAEVAPGRPAADRAEWPGRSVLARPRGTGDRLRRCHGRRAGRAGRCLSGQPGLELRPGGPGARLVVVDAAVVLRLGGWRGAAMAGVGDPRR